MATVQMNFRCNADDDRLIRAAAVIEGKTPGEYLIDAVGPAVTRTLERVITGSPSNLPSRREAVTEFMQLMGRSHEIPETEAEAPIL